MSGPQSEDEAGSSWVYEDIDRTERDYWCPVHNLIIGWPDDVHEHVWVEVHQRKIITLTVLP